MKKFVAAFALFVLMACGAPAADKPKNLIADDVMVEILYDLAVMDAIRSHSPLSLQSRAINPSNYIYKKYGIDSLQFAQSNQYYAADIDEYKKIYTRVGELINANKAKADSLVLKGQKDPNLKVPQPIEDNASGGQIR